LKSEKWDDKWVVNVLVAGCCIDLATYTFVLGLSLNNAVKFLVVQARWKTFYLTGFYALTFLVTLGRIVYFYSSLRILLAEYQDPVWTRNVYYFYYCDNIALTSKAALGLFQIGSMIDLAIHVKLTAEKMDHSKAQTQKDATKMMVCIVSLPLISVGMLRAMIESDSVFAPEKLTDARIIFWNSVPPTTFLGLSIGLTVACIWLMVRMKRYFPRSLKDEGCRIKTIFIVFTVSYMIRAII